MVEYEFKTENIPHGTPVEEKRKIFDSWTKEGWIRGRCNIVIGRGNFYKLRRPIKKKGGKK